MPFSPDSLQVHFRFLTAQVYVFLKRNSPSPVCATYIFLDVKPSTKTWWTYQDHTLKENAILSFSGYQSPVPPGLGMRLRVPISSLHAGILSDVISHRSCLPLQPPWVLLCSCPAVCGKHCLLVVTHCLCAMQSFLLLFCHDPWALGRMGTMQRFHLRLKDSFCESLS